MGNQDKYVYLRALDALREIDVPLDVAAEQFAEAVKILDGASIVDAATFWIQNQAAQTENQQIAEVVNELLESTLAVGRSALYLTDLRLRLRRFSASFHCPISSVSTNHE